MSELILIIGLIANIGSGLVQFAIWLAMMTIIIIPITMFLDFTVGNLIRISQQLGADAPSI